MGERTRVSSPTAQPVRSAIRPCRSVGLEARARATRQGVAVRLSGASHRATRAPPATGQNMGWRLPAPTSRASGRRGIRRCAHVGPRNGVCLPATACFGYPLLLGGGIPEVPLPLPLEIQGGHDARIARPATVPAPEAAGIAAPGWREPLTKPAAVRAGVTRPGRVPFATGIPRHRARCRTCASTWPRSMRDAGIDRAPLCCPTPAHEQSIDRPRREPALPRRRPQPAGRPPNGRPCGRECRDASLFAP